MKEDLFFLHFLSYSLRLQLKVWISSHGLEDYVEFLSGSSEVLCFPLALNSLNFFVWSLNVV